jgi:hypothetical protein
LADRQPILFGQLEQMVDLPGAGRNVVVGQPEAFVTKKRARPFAGQRIVQQGEFDSLACDIVVGLIGIPPRLVAKVDERQIERPLAPGQPTRVNRFVSDRGDDQVLSHVAWSVIERLAGHPLGGEHG